MIRGLINNTTIPILSESIHFAEARHDVLVSNVANIDTPGYIARDLPVETFQERLAEAIRARREASGSLSTSDGTFEDIDLLQHVREEMQTIVRHDGVDVGLEHQVLDISKNQFMHNLAITVLSSQFRLLQAMISEHL